jgi:hypothetical protein
MASLRNVNDCDVMLQGSTGAAHGQTPRGIMALPHADGWWVNHKQVEHIWRQDGRKVPRKQPKRGRPWLNDGSCIRLRRERVNH